MKSPGKELLPNGFTPSEAVLIHGELFAELKRRFQFTELAVLLDGKTKVNIISLASGYIEAAILANVAAGVIELDIETNDETGEKCLVCFPTGKKFDWPPYTLESRLILEEPVDVFTLIENWVIEESPDSWKRAQELGKIMLVLRGHAVFNYDLGKREYLLANEKVKTLSADAAAKARFLINDSFQNHYEKYDLLINGLVASMNYLTNPESGSNFDWVDPWLAELPADSEKYISKKTSVPITPNKYRYFFGFPFAAVLYGVLFKLSDYYNIMTMTIGAFLTALLYLSLSFSNIPFFRERRKRALAKWEKSGTFTRETIDRSEKSIFNKFFLIFLQGPFLTCFVIAIFLLIKHFPPAAIFILLAAAFIIYINIQKKIAATINKKVSGENNKIPPHEVSLALVEERGPTSPPDVLSVEWGNKDMPEAKIFDKKNVPGVSEASQKRIFTARLRRPAIFMMYLKFIYFLCIGTVVLQAAFSIHLFAVSAPGSTLVTSIFKDDVSQILFVEFALMFFTIGWPIRKYKFSLGLLISILFSNTGDTGILDGEQMTGSIRAKRWALLGVLWIFLMLLNIHYYAKAEETAGIIFCIFGLTVIIVYIWQIQVKRRKVEILFPYYTPVNLLALRVFGNSHYSNLDLVSDWEHIGPINRLDGPDTIGWKFSDVRNYLSGRPQDLIVEDDKELEKALKQFKSKPDSNLCFHKNSMQCNNDTWKKSFSLLLSDSDLIILDLGNLTEKNQGVAYEIGMLLNTVPLHNLFILIDYSTDRKVLKKILNNAWNSMSPQSPNRLNEYKNIHLYDTGGSSYRDKESETLTDWKRRQGKRLDGDILVGLLLDNATSERLAAPDTKRDAPFIYWTGLGFSSGVRKAWNFSLAVLLVLIILYTIFH